MSPVTIPGRTAVLGSGFLLLLLTFGGCGLLRRGPLPVDRTQDPRILREVQERLAEEPSIDESLIRVSVDGAIVTLFGTVVGIDGWNCAILNAQLVEGVRSVVDYLAIERGRSLPCQARRSTMARNLPPPTIAGRPARSPTGNGSSTISARERVRRATIRRSTGSGLAEWSRLAAGATVRTETSFPRYRR